jgi:hypothetical protein
MKKEYQFCYCGIGNCFEEAVCYRLMEEKIKIGALGYQKIGIPLCKEHDDKAFNVDQLVSEINIKK